jgi:hypothetical protein
MSSFISFRQTWPYRHACVAFSIQGHARHRDHRRARHICFRPVAGRRYLFLSPQNIEPWVSCPGESLAGPQLNNSLAHDVHREHSHRASTACDKARGCFWAFCPGDGVQISIKISSTVNRASCFFCRPFYCNLTATRRHECRHIAQFARVIGRTQRGLPRVYPCAWTALRRTRHIVGTRRPLSIGTGISAVIIVGIAS